MVYQVLLNQLLSHWCHLNLNFFNQCPIFEWGPRWFNTEHNIVFKRISLSCEPSNVQLDGIFRQLSLLLSSEWYCPSSINKMSNFWYMSHYWINTSFNDFLYIIILCNCTLPILYAYIEELYIVWHIHWSRPQINTKSSFFNHSNLAMNFLISMWSNEENQRAMSKCFLAALIISRLNWRA